MATQTPKIITPKVTLPAPSNPQVAPETTPPLVGKHRSLQNVANITTIPVPAFTARVLVQATKGTVRFTMDGSDPSGEAGFRLPADWRPFPIDWQPGMQLKIVGETPESGFEYQPFARNGRWGP